MTYSEAIRFLYELRWFGAKFGLENTRRLATLVGNPEKRLRFIHVAGTNGKGSTCAMLESIYRAAGFRTGLFTSPHLVTFGERIQVNRELIPEANVVELTAELQPLLATFPHEHHPTFFEVITVMALLYFERKQCDLVVWETGLGGRLDATNIVTPLASVITNIHYDHQKWLGETLGSIAREKAGIIKPEVPVVTGVQPGEAFDVIAAAGRERGAPLTIVGPRDLEVPPLDSIRLPLPGEHQRLNAALAVATMRVLQSSLRVEESALRHGLERVHWPGRLQQIERPDGRPLLLDGAHNIAGVETLVTSLHRDFPGTSPTLVLGILADKDWEAMCQMLAPLAARMLLVPVPSERAAEPQLLARVCRQANPQARVDTCNSLREALEVAAADPFVVVTGSLYLVGEALELLKVSACPDKSERELNEWGLFRHG